MVQDSRGGSGNSLKVHGHRGARAVRPENTVPGFEYAIEQGADAIEMDMVVTKDGAIVVSHDPVLHSGAVIHRLTLAQIRERKFLPTLDEVFDLAPRGEFLFDIEIKSFPDHPEWAPPPDQFARLVLDRVHAHRLERRVIVLSFDFRTLVAMKKIAREMALSALYEGAPKDFTAIAKEAGAGIVSPQFNLVTPEQVRAAHAAGLQVVPWTANTPEDWDRLIAAGVDAIITDDPAALIAHLRSK